MKDENGTCLGAESDTDDSDIDESDTVAGQIVLDKKTDIRSQC